MCSARAATEWLGGTLERLETRLSGERRSRLDTLHLLLVCTANQGRSPMAEALLRGRLAERGLDGVVTVESAGFMEGGVPCSPPVLEAVRAYGADLREHRSRRLTEKLVARADLVVGLAGEHARGVAAFEAAARVPTFTLKELLRVVEAAGPRRPDEPVADYLARLDRGVGGRSRSAPSDVDDIADPYGRPVDT